MHKNDYRPPDRSRKQRFLTQEEIEKGKKGKWTELEITGKLFRIFFLMVHPLYRDRFDHSGPPTFCQPHLLVYFRSCSCSESGIMESKTFNCIIFKR